MSQASGKWFHELPPHVPVREAARRVIAVRGGVVAERTDATLAAPGSDPEDIHQLRVAARRFVAAVDIFRPALSDDACRKLRRTAARMRRGAGVVRDMDVQRLALAARINDHAWVPPEFAGRLDDLLSDRRERALQVLLDELPRLKERFGRQLQRAQDQLLSRAGAPTAGAAGAASSSDGGESCPAGPPIHTLGELAVETLRNKLAALMGAGQADLDDPDNVHQLRITGKRLRYALEVFAGCVPAPALDAIYGDIESLQEELGEINDLRELFTTLADLRPQLVKQGRAAEREAAASLLDRLHGIIGHEWISRQRLFVQRWRGGAGETLRERFDSTMAGTDAAPRRVADDDWTAPPAPRAPQARTPVPEGAA